MPSWASPKNVSKRRTLGNYDDLSWAAAHFFARDTAAKRPGDDFEALLLERVDVLGCDKGPRLEVHVRQTEFATRIACGLAEDDFFSRHGMFKHIT